MFEVRQQHPDFLLQNLLLNSPESDAAWSANERHLLEIATLTRRLGADLIVHIFPADVQVQESHYSFYEALGILTDRSFLTGNRPQERLARFCADASLRCYDLLPALRRRERPRAVPRAGYAPERRRQPHRVRADQR
jgi:hypothetical protein